MQLCACGCGEGVGIDSRGRSWRFLPRHQPKKRWEDYPPPVRDEESGCLRWRGPHHSAGYGKVGSKRYAHQVAYERVYGPIPEGMEIDHVRERGCLHRDCVEVSHLEAVSHAENMRRSQKIQEQMARTHCPKGHEYEGWNLMVRRGKRECRTCTYDRNAKNRQKRKASR